MILTLPSYIIQGTYLENIRFIDKNYPEITGVELLFFYYDDETKKLLLDEIKGINEYSNRFTYTVHLPDNIDDKATEVVEILDKTADGFIVHPPLDSEKGTVILKNWINRFGNRFFIENLISRPAETLSERIENPRLCLDTGHIILNNLSPLDYYKKYSAKISEIHLHGVIDGADHRYISTEDSSLLEFSPYLKQFNGIINLEMFNQEDVNVSLSTLRNWGIIA